MKIIYKKEFVVVILNIDNKIFMIHIAALLKAAIMSIYFFLKV